MFELLNQLKKAPKIFWIIVSIAGGTSLVAVSIGFGALLVKASNFAFNTGKLQVSVGADELSNDMSFSTELLNKKFDNFEKRINQLTPYLPENLESQVTTELDDLKKTAKVVKKQTDTLDGILDLAK